MTASMSKIDTAVKAIVCRGLSNCEACVSREGELWGARGRDCMRKRQVHTSVIKHQEGSRFGRPSTRSSAVIVAV